MKVGEFIDKLIILDVATRNQLRKAYEDELNDELDDWNKDWILESVQELWKTFLEQLYEEIDV